MPSSIAPDGPLILRRHLVVGKPFDRSCDPDRAIVVGGHGAVAARSGGGQLDRDIAFLADADHGDRRGDSADHAVEHGIAFVEAEPDVRAALLEQGRHGLCAFSAAFLVMAEGEIDRLPRPVAAREQALGRFEDRHQRALVVDRAAPDHEAVCDGAAERRSAPFAFASRLDRNDVLVGHQEEGGGRRVAARPGEQQAPSGDLLALQLRVDAGKALLKEGMERRERFG